VPYETSLQFDSINVIESLLPPDDLRTGKDLFESVLAPYSIADPGFVTGYRDVATRAEFFGALRGILSTTGKYGLSPIIHIEAHGDAAGIELKSMEHVEWMEIAPLLAKINEAARMNLLVVAALCRGWNMISILRPIDRSPAFAVLGTEEEPKAGDLYRAMKAFYQSLLEEPLDLRRGLDAANGGVPLSEGTYGLLTAELMLCRVFRTYVAGDPDETESQRVSRLVVDLARQQGADLRQTMYWRYEITKDIRDYSRWFEHYRKKFLMLDLFPDNERRFPMRYNDCRPVAA